MGDFFQRRGAVVKVGSISRVAKPVGWRVFC